MEYFSLRVVQLRFLLLGLAHQIDGNSRGTEATEEFPE